MFTLPGNIFHFYICTNKKKYFFHSNSEYEIIIEDEKIEPQTGKLSTSDEAELKEFEKILKAKNPTFQNDESINESLEESVTDVKEDKMFLKFKEKIDSYPDQVLRYGKGETPLWVSDSNIPSSIPDCEHCGSERRFEFQVFIVFFFIWHPICFYV